MILQNRQLSVSVNDRGQLEALTPTGRKNIITRPAGLFRAILHCNENWEDTVSSDDQTFEITQPDENTMVLKTSRLNALNGPLDITVTLTITLSGDKVQFDSHITNNSTATLDEWVYPRIGVMESLGKGEPDLLYPRHIGERIRGICSYLAGMNGREALHEITASYPGPMSMQWMMLTDKENCLYFSGRDDLFYIGALRAVGSKNGGVTMEMNKMGFVRPGESWQCPAYITWLYKGNWMQGAQEYAQWASTWRKPVRPKDWIRRMNGYFLVINKQQYGDEVWPYSTIPQLYDYAVQHGFDTLGLFGWYHSGHDNQYPSLEVSPTMGGEDKLKSGIKAVQKKGGHVTLYYQGHLMDIGTTFYKTTGHLLSGRNRWGTPYYEFYDKFCKSDYLHFFSKKPFATVCPSCTSWHELMAQRADWVHSFGADGILYDQIGGMPPYPCFDESHPHMLGKPSLSHTQGRIALHKRIRAQVDTYKEFAYMTEHVTDVHSQFLDCLHGIGSYPGAKGDGAMGNGIGIHSMIAGANGTGPAAMPEMFRYCFPDTMITIRNSNPYVSRRYANYAFLYGFKLEMELRYRTDRQFIQEDEDPEDRVYVQKISALRRTFEEYLLTGRFMAEESLTNDNPHVKAALYSTDDGSYAAALWNDTDKPQKISVHASVPFTAWHSPDGDGEGVPDILAPQSVILLTSKERA